jgi:hypothetical protein
MQDDNLKKENPEEDIHGDMHREMGKAFFSNVRAASLARTKAIRQQQQSPSRVAAIIKMYARCTVKQVRHITHSIEVQKVFNQIRCPTCHLNEKLGMLLWH